MKITIRPALLIDATNIASVHIASWQVIYREHISDNFLNKLSLQKRAEEWQHYLQADVKVWVAEQNYKIIGFISLCPSRDSDQDPTIVSEISSIYLLPDYWRQGIGQQLYAAAIEDAKQKGRKEVSLWVSDTNNQACRFYEKLGFTATNNLKIEHIDYKQLKLIRYKKLIKC